MLALRDMLQDYWPMKAAFWGAAGPLLRTWNGGWFGGVSLIGDIIQQPLYLPNLLFRALHVPAWPGIGWYLLIHAFLALGGAALLCRRFASPAAAAIGATVFAVSGFQIANLSNVQWACAASWSPVILWAADRVARRPSLRTSAALALVAPQPLLAGDPQAFLVLCACALAVVLARAPRRSEAARWYGAAMGFAALLALPQALASWQALDDLARAQLMTDQIREQWSLHPARIPEFWVPNLYGPLIRDGFWGTFTVQPPHTRSYVWSLYVGALWPALFGFSLAARRRATLLILLGFAALLALALGPHAFHLYLRLSHLVPTWSYYRYPERLLTIPTLACAAIAALGADAFIAGPPRRRAASVALAAGAALGSLALAAWLAPSAPLRETAARAAVFGSATHVALVAGCGALLAWTRGPALAALLCATIAVDLAAANGGLLGAVTRVPFAEPPRACEMLDRALAGSQRDSFRVFVDQTSFDASSPLPEAVQRDLAPWAWPRWREYQRGKRNVLDLCGFLSAAAYTSLDSKDALTLRAAAGPVRALEALGTRLALGMQGTPITRAGRQVGVDEMLGIEVVELNGAVPRLYRPASVENDTAPAARIRSDGRSLTPALALLASSPSQSHGDAPGARIESFHDAGDSIAAEVQHETGGYWVLADSLDRFWSARIDGRPAPLVRADIAHRALWVPAGRHSLLLEHRPRAALAAFAASLVIALGLLAVAAGLFPRGPADESA